MNLFDIIEKQKWHKMQEGFKNALGLCIQTVDLNGKPLPGINEPSSFCLDMMKLSGKKGITNYESCIPSLIDKVKVTKGENHCSCIFGMQLYSIPIDVREEGIVAYVVVGPVLHKQKDIKEYKKIAKENNIPLERLMDGVQGLKRFSFGSIESALELLREVAHYIVQLSYDSNRLKERFNVPHALDNLIKELYSSVYFDELLNTLLDASLHTTKGNTGSIMLLDHDTNELSVKFSRGLRGDIAKKIKVRIGDGISGIAARDKKPLLIDKDIKDVTIKNRLKRPHIKSSIVYPLEVQDRLFGVMNINNTDSKRRFSPETLDLVGDLTRLTQVALRSFPSQQPQ